MSEPKITSPNQKIINSIRESVSKIKTFEEAISYIDTIIQNPDIDSNIKTYLLRWKSLFESYQNLDGKQLVERLEAMQSSRVSDYFGDKFGFVRILREYYDKSVREFPKVPNERDRLKIFTDTMFNPTTLEEDMYKLLVAGFSEKEMFLAANAIFTQLWFKSNGDFNKILIYIDIIHPYYENFRYLCTEALKPEIGLDELGDFEIRIKNLLHVTDFDDEYNLSEILSNFVLMIWEKSHSPKNRVMGIPDEKRRQIRDAFSIPNVPRYDNSYLITELDNYISGLKVLIQVLDEQKLDYRPYERLLTLIQENRQVVFNSIHNPNNISRQIRELISSIDFQSSDLKGILSAIFKHFFRG